MVINCDTVECRAAVEIVRRLCAAGHEAYIVGGAVRNHLLGMPAKDYDVATSARPQQVAGLFAHTMMVGAAFGVALVVLDATRTEVATFRRDGRYIDHRHPSEVHFSTAAEDARRRDFTINALFYDPLRDRVIDFVNGRRDLEARMLRTVGDPGERFTEDALRILRAVRFASRFNLTIDPATREAIRGHRRLLERISAERVRAELVMILTGPAPGDAVRRMHELDLLEVVLPEVAAMAGVAQPPQFHPEGDVLTHTIAALNAMPPSPSATLAFGVLLHDAGKPLTQTETDRIRFNGHAPVGAELASQVCRRLRFSNEQRKQIAGLVKDHMRFLEVRRMKRSKLRRFLAKPRFEEDLALHRADCLASHGSLGNYLFCQAVLEDLRQENENAAPPPLVNGDDLIALGQKPGPHFKTLLQEIYDRQLEGEFTTREQALHALARRLA